MISSIEPAGPPEPEGRYIVRFTTFAEPPVPTPVWNGQRNPVAYTTLTRLGFDSKSLVFVPVTRRNPNAQSTDHLRGHQDDVAPLTIAAAKRGLALHYGVKPEAIEVIIRG